MAMIREEQTALMHKLKNLFVFYIGAPAVGNWEEFLTSVRLAQRELSLGGMTQAEYDAFMAPHNAALGYDSAELIKCGAPSMQRYNSNHLLTVEGQEQFLNDCEKTDFLPAFKPIAEYFVSRLKAMPKREYSYTDCYVKELQELAFLREIEELEYLDYMDGELDSDELVGF